jgi:DnaA N-terminal domain
VNHPATTLQPSASKGGASLRSSVFGFQTTSNPPVPPQAAVLADTLSLDPVPLHVRQQRVRNGSKRKRDLEAVRMAEELELLQRLQAEQDALRASGVEPDPCRELRAWVRARRRLRRSLTPSTYALWIKPLRPAGSLDDLLFLTAPDGIRTWTERRYSSLIAEALEGTDFARVTFAEAPVVAGGEG